MSLHFRNQYTTTISVAIMWHGGCSELGNWSTKGWWVMAPGQTKNVLDEDLEDINRYFYFYAFAVDGAEWSGPVNVCVPKQAFEWCINLCDNNPSTRGVGMRELDIGDNDTYTVNLIA